MLSHRFYYGLKPYVPWRIRMALRRLSARHKRGVFSDVWPIDSAASTPPDGWSGWPDGRRFAFVLTHDVEGPAGLAKCRALADLEEQLGFRSCFNFIPEGSYSVSPAIRAELTSRGFEVGVHDLEHDGKLFHSRRGFAAKAARINRYIHAWGACGFRAGFMLRNLAWLHDLEIAYDSSTFDTDPFEPQSDGAGTIFPYWVARDNTEGSRGAYLELPYTLPQDSTLFLVLQETSAEIWLRKLDWIARHGGMALVNVHPDYLCFDGSPTERTYPVSHYIRLLEYVQKRYAGEFWQPLPRELSRYVSELPLRAQRVRRRVCMITHSFYESDNRVMRYANALVNRGDHVDVLALRRSRTLPIHEVIDGVSVYRLQDRIGKNERTRIGYVWPMLRFLAVSAWWLTRKHRRRPYDLLHVHSMPDFLVFACWYPRLRRVPLILDMHDFMPDLYATKFRGKGSAWTAILHFLERRSARFADHIILANHLWIDKYGNRTASKEKCSVFINNVDTRVFQPRPRTRNDDKVIILFPGGLQWHQGLDIALKAFRRIKNTLPQAEFHIYGDGEMKPSLVALARELSFNGSVKFFEPVEVKEIIKIMANADLGVVPKRADSFGNEAYSTKIMEFMSLGVPVVVSRTKIDQFYFDDSVVRFFESGNPEALASAMLDVLRDSVLRLRLIENATAYSHQHSWSQRKNDYLRIVDGLIAHTTPAVVR